ncbi:carotenoid cleavage dioxygenase-like enzyme [Nocardia sp. GAS34]|uniref:carotenoid oxygenase family protein n=1 Tax=unclassified Nocardia TaxID=2637762 RepID=UPI003D23D403
MNTPVPHLLGNFAPVPTEISATELPVTGAIPPELTGWYLRNGPNPRTGSSAHWFVGDGMVHGVRLEAGRAVAYRNRWVRTTRFTGEILGDNGIDSPDLTAGVANTHVVRHAGHTFALVESALPYELDMRAGRELDTLGAYDFDGRLHTAMTAHPKVCPRTGELHFFGYGAHQRPYLTYHRADATGNLVYSRPIEVTAPTMMHDFHLTSRHVVFMDLPMVFDPVRAQSPGMPFSWNPDYGARLGVLDRAHPETPVRWFDIEPCYVFHSLNAHEDPTGQILTLHVVRYDHLGDGVALGGRGELWRWNIDLAAGTVTEHQIDDRPTEFPRIDDRLAGLPARHGHTTSGAVSGEHARAGALHRYDLHSDTATSYVFPQGRNPGEAAFAPADDNPGGPGWLLTYVYDAATDRSDLVILDADDIAAGPVAEIHLPRRVPAGFHGNWLPDDPALISGGHAA